MDLSHQFSPSTGLEAHLFPIPNESHCASPLLLQLIDQNSENQRSGCVVLEEGADSEDGQRGEEFSIVGHPISLKRQRGDSLSPCYFSSVCPSKRAAMEPDLETRRETVRSWGDNPLHAADQAMYEIMEKERQRQIKGIELFASEKYVCQAVLDALGSPLTNKYSEGMQGTRYYGGNQYIDEVERLCCMRALAVFNFDPGCWGVNVHPYSCTSANLAVYTDLLQSKDRIMGLDGHV